MRGKNVSLKAIASRVGVSINTVSHALRDLDDISKPLKIKIRKTAIEMGYMPNHVAQKMKKDEQPVIALFGDNFSNLYFNKLFGELLKAFNGYGIELLLMFSSNFGIEMVKKCILQRVDVIITHSIYDDETAEFARLNNMRILYIGDTLVLDEERMGIDSVSIDNRCGCQLAARYFNNFHTCNKYVFVGRGYEYSYFRYEVFKEEIAKINTEVQVDYYNIEKEDIIVLYEKILNGYRSVFCFNDETAYTMLRKLDSLVVDVRRMFPDLHILGFDGLCAWIDGLRQISTIMIDYEQFAEKVFEVAKFRVENPNAPSLKITLPVTLHQRKE